MDRRCDERLYREQDDQKTLRHAREGGHPRALNMSRGVVDPRLRGDDASGEAEAEHVSTLRSASDDRLVELIRVSLAIWGVAATVDVEPDGGLRLTLDDGSGVRVGRAPEGIPFRWMVRVNNRERPASSVTGLLRVLRSTLDPEWRAGRARIVPLAIPAPIAAP